MKLIIYCSKLIPQNESVQTILADINSKASRKNSQYNITGLLIFENNHFIQAVEGDDMQVDLLIDKISKDQRHEQMTILVDKPVQQRHFNNWNMDTLNLDQQDIFNTENIKILRDAYQRNIDISDAMFITLLKDFFNHPDINKALNNYS